AAATRVAVDDLALALGDGRVRFAGALARERVEAHAELVDVPLDVLDLAFPRLSMQGHLSGRLDVRGPRAAPTGELDLRVLDVRERATAARDLPPVHGRVQGSWRGGRLRVEGTLGGFAAEELALGLDMPLAVAPDGGGLIVAGAAPIDGSARWQGDVGPLWDLLVTGNDRLEGAADLSLALAGTVAAPRLQGQLTLERGRYENLVSGTVLDDIELVLTGDDDRLVLSEGRAGDGNGGQLGARGALELDAAAAFPVRLAVDIAHATLVRRDDLTARASGRLELGGDTRQATLEGSIEIEEAEARLVNRLPPQVVTLKVREVNGAGQADRQSARESRAGGAVLDLALAVSAPGKVFVRGLGLDSEWSGEIDIGGTAASPSLEGVLFPVRGRYIFAGKVFSLADGSLRFTGGPDVDPLLDLSADYRADDITAVITVTGRASSPQIALSSRPPLPESEIASRVLFGRGTGQLTPAQTVQLASAVASLSGAGSDGLLEGLRRNLGVDVINVGESRSGETAVSVGKYIGHGVYLELEQGAKAGTGGASVEVEVTPNVRLESGVDERGENKVGVKWKWDY
ncbi:MAG: translocation/assembly module TamB domain-containing protein, partial [Gammaproteobacteria bacterium]|nr:translocation/assembly module TamB domain-containing protein [Gammaproteobacteria bacterium]